MSQNQHSISVLFLPGALLVLIYVVKEEAHSDKQSSVPTKHARANYYYRARRCTAIGFSRGDSGFKCFISLGPKVVMANDAAAAK